MRPRKPSDPWVLEPKAFVKWLERERVQLTDEQIALASVHLSLYLRRECPPLLPGVRAVRPAVG